MKKLSIYIILAGFLGLTGCDKKLDLTNPQSIDASLALGTDAKVKQVLIGNYAQLGSGSLFGGNVLWMSELMASDAELRWVGTFPDPRQIWGKSILVNNSYVRTTYAQAYAVIYNANNILANLNVVNAADKNRVEGETKFQRALVYFELIKFFGEKAYSFGNSSLKGVPLIITPRPGDPLSPENQLPRNTIEEVYTQIIADLTSAETLLPARNSFYANKASASLALARVYLQQGKYAEARDAANRCITTATTNGFGIVGAYASAFNNSSNTIEDLFSMQVNTQTGTNSCFTFFSTSTYGARDGDIEVLQKHIDKYTVGDTRRNLFFVESGIFYCGKWRDQFRNVKVMRLAEAYLTRAECNSRLGTSIGATVASDLNVTRGRAGLALLAAPTLSEILQEREKELAFEGHGFADAKRLRLTVDGFTFDDNKMVFPIPERERNIYPVEQNPGYPQ
jgi:starch-binding outer membrane protein, SusD/RagB family